MGKGIFFSILAWGGKGKEEKKEGEKRRNGETEIREDGWGERGWQS